MDRDNWREGILTDLGTVSRGRSRHRPRNDPVLFGGSYPFFQTGDVKAATLWLDNYWATYSDVGLEQSKLWPPETLCITIAANIADSAILGIPGCFPDSIVGFTVDDSVADVRFVKYMIDHIQQRFQGISRGTTQDNLSLEKLLSVKLRYPPLGAQRRIGTILSAYDELIENNSGRIELLEEMARRIYREWFVEFRYPGHAEVPLVESESGPIPQGWSSMPASEAISIDPKTRIPQGEDMPFVPMTSVAETTMHIWPVKSRTSMSGSKFINGDTLFARITPCLENGKTAYVQCLGPGQVAVGSTEFIVLRAHRLSAEAVYLLARSDGFRQHAIKSMSGASGRQRVRRGAFDTYFIAVPDTELRSIFSDIVRPIFDESNRLFLAIQSLRTTRDLLLPRLVSGEIDVEELDISTEDLAA